MNFARILESAGPILKTVAPTIATALGGPLAGTAVKFLGDALLPDVANPSEKDIVSAIQQNIASPETLAKLKKIETDFEARMKELDIDLERVHAEDRNSARQRQVQMKDQTPAVLGFLIVAGFFASLAMLAFVDLPMGSADPFKLLVGALGAMTVQVGNYFFGSSAGSKLKTEAMTKRA